MNSELTQAVRQKGLLAGAALVGVADVAALRRLSREADPEDFLRGARRMIVAAAADPPGIVQAEDGAEYSSLAFPGYSRADAAARAMAGLLRRRGFRSFVVPRASPVYPGRRGRLVKSISIKHAAEAAGLGAMGWNRLVITREYGPRVRLAGLLTDAPLAADPPCAAPPCTGCGVCVEACPAGAVSENGFDAVRCSLHLFSGARPDAIAEAAGRFDVPALWEHAGLIAETAAGWLCSLASMRPLYYTCGGCVRSCPVGNSKVAEKR